MIPRPLSLPPSVATRVPIQRGHQNGSKKRKFAQSSGVFYRRRTTINILPDDVLLEIFDFCQIESNSSVPSFRHGSGWFRLVHVCRRWRQIVLVSPWRLNLALFCTYGTPVRKHLGCLPPLPIIVDYLTFWDNKSPAPNYEDDIIAALEHPDRVRSIKLAVTSSLLEVAAPVLQEPFSALTTLWLSSKDPDAPVVPDISSSGPAPHLWQIMLEGISFPRLPTLLSSASNLVDLQLKDIPQSGYISPEVMATSLALLNRLYSLCICFKAPISRLYIRSSPASTRHVLNLVTFNFRGSSEYLEHLLAQIDTPRLHGIIITYFNQLDFQVPQLSEFVRRTEHLELAQSRYSQGRMRISSLYVELDFEDEERRRSGFTLRISCKWPDWQVSHLAQILGQFPALVSNVDHLSIDEDDLQLEPGWKDSMDDTDWIELLHPFTAVKKLHGSRQLAQHIALALGSVSGEMITEILPALSSLSLEDQPVRPVEKFLAARQISGHPVNFVDPALGSATNSERHDPTDLLVDGFIARTFGSEDANGYLMRLLRVPSSKHFLQYYGILHHEGAWYITHNNNLVQGTSPCVPLQPTPLLDYSATAYGAVVPQRRWTPADEVYVRRQTVESAALQLPIFFVNHDGHLGFWLPDILKDFYHDLHNANEAAPLGGRAFAHIRIHWPGYGYSKRQISCADSFVRNPSTVAGFLKHIGTSVDTFFRECISDYNGSLDPRWTIGAGGITQENVMIIGAINVSSDSWMPILQLIRYVF